MIAIEVDGGSHQAISRQIQDEKKEKLLKHLGWKVYRYKNQEVMKI